MRDINRIPHILVTLGRLWRKEPDLRLGQLICILSSKLGYNEPLFVEDDEILKAMESILKEYEK